jgi:hypothetical protein
MARIEKILIYITGFCFLLVILAVIFPSFFGFLVFFIGKTMEPEPPTYWETIAKETPRPCKHTKGEDFIDFSIEYMVENYSKFPPPFNHPSCLKTDDWCYSWFPYHSVTEFKLKNPNCCFVVKDLKNDDSIYGPHLRGEKYPQIYEIRVNYYEMRMGYDRKPKLSLWHHTEHYDCFGRRISGD